MTGLEDLVEKVSAMPQLGQLAQRAGAAWKGLNPGARHALMGAGVGLGASLLDGPDAQGETHHLRNMALGAGGGYALGKYSPWMMQKIRDSAPGAAAAVSGSPPIQAPPSSLPPQMLLGPKTAAFYMAGAAAAFEKLGNLTEMSYDPTHPEIQALQQQHGANWKSVLGQQRGIDPSKIYEIPPQALKMQHMASLFAALSAFPPHNAMQAKQGSVIPPASPYFLGAVPGAAAGSLPGSLGAPRRSPLESMLTPSRDLHLGAALEDFHRQNQPALRRSLRKLGASSAPATSPAPAAPPAPPVRGAAALGSMFGATPQQGPSLNERIKEILKRQRATP